MFKFLLLMLLGFFIFRYLRRMLFGAGATKKEVPRRENPGAEKPFQEKHRGEIEDADFEDLD